MFLLAQTFDPEDYGAYALITTFSAFGVFLLGLNLYIYVYRAVPGKTPEEQLAIFKTTFTFELVLASAISLLLWATGAIVPLLSLFKAAAYADEFLLALPLLVALIAAAEVQHYLWARTEIEHNNRMDLITQGLWVIPLLVVWRVGWDITVAAVVIANLAGVTLGVLYGLRRVDIRSWLAARFDKATLRTATAFSIPMIVPSLSFYVLQLSDRFFLARYWTLGEVGIYSFAYTLLNTIYALTATVLLNATLPYVVEAHNRGDVDKKDRLLTYSLKASLGAFVLIAGALVVLSKPVLSLIAREEYFAAGRVIPLLAVAYLFVILAYPAHYLLMLQDRTRAILVLDLIGLAVGIAANFALIPPFSYAGAAVATIVGFGTVAGLKHVASKSWRHIRLGDLLSFKAETRAVMRLLGATGAST